MQLRWSHAVVFVRDLDAMLDFYTNVLGFEVSDRGPLAPGAPEIVFMSQVETDHHQLAFAPVRQGEEPPNSVDHLPSAWSRWPTCARCSSVSRRTGAPPASTP